MSQVGEIIFFVTLKWAYKSDARCLSAGSFGKAAIRLRERS